MIVYIQVTLTNFIGSRKIKEMGDKREYKTQKTVGFRMVEDQVSFLKALRSKMPRKTLCMQRKIIC